MALELRLNNIQSPNDFTLYYKSGPTVGSLTNGFTQYGGTYAGGTSTITITGASFSFDTVYWIKLLDSVTGRYIVENLKFQPLEFYNIVLPIPTQTPTTTPTLTSTPTSTPTLTPTSTATTTPVSTQTSTTTDTPTPTPTIDVPTSTPTLTLTSTPTVTPTTSEILYTEILSTDANWWDVDLIAPFNIAQDAVVNRPGGNVTGTTVEVVIKWILPNNPGGTSTQNVWFGGSPGSFYEQITLDNSDNFGDPITYTYSPTLIPAGTTSPYYQTITVTTNAQNGNYQSWLDGQQIDVSWGFFTPSEYTD